MSQIEIVSKGIQTFGNGEIIREYTIDGIELNGKVSSESVPPLRILLYLLKRKGMDCEFITKDYDPWNITKIILDEKNAQYAKVALEEIMEYCCSYEADRQCKEIIRQLPFDVAMKTSLNIMNYGKSLDEHNSDLLLSSQKWRQYNAMLGRYSDSNPNDTIDNLVIPKEEPQLRKHLIYKSSRGGYNIKTKGYSDSSLDHYCFVDTGKWD